MLPKTLLLAATAISAVQAHTTFTDFFVDGTPQGDGTCVRMNQNIQQATFPISDVTSDDMACGIDGQTVVARVCPANTGSTLTFEFRSWPDGSKPGSIDASHKGPCAVYMKSVSSAAASNTATGPGWFKVFSEDYDSDAQKWCTEKIMATDGYLSVQLPSDIKGGYYLVRTELLALQQADKTPADPQFYIGCAQVFLKGQGTNVPSDTVSIPGYINMNDNKAALTFNIYNEPMALPYPMLGPPVYGTTPKRSIPIRRAVPQPQTQGLPPASCVLTNSNWCGIEQKSYTTEDGCWAASKDCWNQATTCYDTAGPTGSKNCPIWESKCKGIQDACNAGNFNGPPNKGNVLTPALAKPQGLPPAFVSSGDTSGSASPATPAPVGASAPVVSSAPASSTGSKVGTSIDQCGSNNGGATCVTGMCCSQHGYCGTNDDYCGAGCQGGFGRCASAMKRGLVSRMHVRHLQRHLAGAGAKVGV